MSTLNFESLPNLTRHYLKAVVQRRSAPTEATEKPDLTARAAQVKVDDLSDYYQICALADDGLLPPTYPQVLATPLHAAIVSHPDFPLPALGMVHLENSVIQHRPIEVGEPFELVCQVSGWHWDRHLGIKFAIDTHATDPSGQPLWKSTLWALSRGQKKALEKKPGKTYPDPPVGAPPQAKVSSVIDVPADMGRRYAAVCGDYNPIHLTQATARLFGFRRHIVHGMWTFGRCWADLATFAPREDLHLSVRFKQPLYLPSTAVLNAVEKGEKLAYEARNLAGDRLFLEGTVG